jgi:hypothetical protein
MSTVYPEHTQLPFTTVRKLRFGQAVQTLSEEHTEHEEGQIIAWHTREPAMSR